MPRHVLNTQRWQHQFALRRVCACFSDVIADAGRRESGRRPGEHWRQESARSRYNSRGEIRKYTSTHFWRAYLSWPNSWPLLIKTWSEGQRDEGNTKLVFLQYWFVIRLTMCEWHGVTWSYWIWEILISTHSSASNDNKSFDNRELFRVVQ